MHNPWLSFQTFFIKILKIYLLAFKFTYSKIHSSVYSSMSFSTRVDSCNQHSEKDPSYGYLPLTLTHIPC